MFNSVVKEQFIANRCENIKSSPDYLKNIFYHTENYEVNKNKDIAEFSKNEILDYYRSKKSASIYILQTLNSNLRIYHNWYQNNIKNDIDESYSLIKADDLRECVDKSKLNNRIVSRKTILEWCVELPNAREKVIILALFEGIKGKNYEELTRITIDDLYRDGNNFKIHLCTGRDISISHELYNYMLEANHEKYNYSISGTTDKQTPFYDIGYVIKYNHNANLTANDSFKMGRSIQRCLNRALDYLGVLDVMDSKAIVESGKIEMIKQISIKEGVDLTDAVLNNRTFVLNPIVKRVEEIFNSKILIKTILIDYRNCFLE